MPGRFRHANGLVRYATTIALVLALCSPLALGGDRPGMPEPGKGYSVLNEGNSLMGQMHTYPRVDGKNVRQDGRSVPLIAWMAHEWGYPEHYSTGVGAAGVPIDWCWINLAKRKEFHQKRDSQEWDVFTVQPFGFQNRRDPEVEAYAAAQFYRAMLERNPSIPLLIYQTWPSGRSAGGAHFQDLGVALEDGGGDADKYAKGLQLAIDTHMNPIAHILRQEFPDKPVYVMPVPQVFLAVHEKLKQEGEFAGIKHMADLLDQGGRSVHVSRKGQWLTAMTQLASMYAKNPAKGENIPADYGTVFAFDLKAGALQPGLTAKQADQLAQLAWDVVSTCPATAASGKPFAFEDMTPPTPARITASKLAGVQQAELAWTPGSDDRGVLKQVIYVNGDLHETLPPKATNQGLTDLVPGKVNRVVVRTFDSAYNLADAVVEIDVPAIQGRQLAGWDLSTYASYPEKSRSKVKPKSADSVETSELSKALRGPMAITRGPGLDRTGTSWGILNLGDAKATSLEEAVAANDYFTFTVTPADRKTVALSALTLPIRFHHSRLGRTRLALFTSSTGFKPDDVLETITPPVSACNLGFDLSAVEQLRTVSKPVEVRVYVVQSGQLMVGSPGAAGMPEPDIILYGSVK